LDLVLPAALPALPDAVFLIVGFPVLSLAAAVFAFFGLAAVSSPSAAAMSMSSAAHDRLKP